MHSFRNSRIFVPHPIQDATNVEIEAKADAIIDIAIAYVPDAIVIPLPITGKESAYAVRSKAYDRFARLLHEHLDISAIASFINIELAVSPFPKDRAEC